MKKMGSRIYSSKGGISNISTNPILSAPLIPDRAPDSVEDDSDMEAVKTAMLAGTTVYELTEKYPDKILRAIKDYGVVKLGEMEVDDSLVLDAFGNETMLTRGMDASEDVNWSSNWLIFLKQRAKAGCKAKMGWSKKVRVGAYVVAIKDAANPRFEGLLHPILLNVKAGSASPAVMQLPALKALLRHKWHTWARRTLVFETALYLTWLISFMLFLYFFKTQGSTAWTDNDLMHSVWGSAAALANLIAILSMLPFVAIEINTMIEYRLAWFSSWNLIDAASYIIQTMTFFFYFTSSRELKEDWFSILLAAQSILIFLRLQFYLRAFSSVQVSFVDILTVVLQKSQSFFIMLFSTIFSFAMGFYILYRAPIKLPDDVNDSDTTFEQMYDYFSTPWMACNTVFEMMLGSFEFETFFIQKGLTPCAATIIFITFHALVTITYLNLLIAIITEAYLKIMDKEQVYRDNSRAYVIDELEMMLPSFLLRKRSDPYIHFLAVMQDNGHPSDHKQTLFGSLSIESISENEPFHMATREIVPSISGHLDEEFINKVATKVAEKVAAKVVERVSAKIAGKVTESYAKALLKEQAEESAALV